MEKQLQIPPHPVEAASGLKRTPHRTGFLALKSPFVQGRGSELPVCEVELADQTVQSEGRQLLPRCGAPWGSASGQQPEAAPETQAELCPVLPLRKVTIRCSVCSPGLEGCVRLGAPGETSVRKHLNSGVHRANSPSPFPTKAIGEFNQI